MKQINILMPRWQIQNPFVFRIACSNDKWKGWKRRRKYGILPLIQITTEWQIWLADFVMWQAEPFVNIDVFRPFATEVLCIFRCFFVFVHDCFLATQLKHIYLFCFVTAHHLIFIVVIIKNKKMTALLCIFSCILCSFIAVGQHYLNIFICSVLLLHITLCYIAAFLPEKNSRQIGQSYFSVLLYFSPLFHQTDSPEIAAGTRCESRAVTDNNFNSSNYH